MPDYLRLSLARDEQVSKLKEGREEADACMRTRTHSIIVAFDKHSDVEGPRNGNPWSFLVCDLGDANASVYVAKIIAMTATELCVADTSYFFTFKVNSLYFTFG